MIDLASLRKEYTQARLDIECVEKSPLDQFKKWLGEALSAQVIEPSAMVLATTGSNGHVSQRTVLLKAFDERGLVFFTNYSSRKAKQMEENCHVSLLFPWYALERQVAVTGLVKKISTDESLLYFKSRPFESQLGAWASHQSQVIASRNVLEENLEAVKQKFREDEVPMPDFWGGYVVVPDSVEFWQGRPSRLHDRIYFSKEGENWKIERLSP